MQSSSQIISANKPTANLIQAIRSSEQCQTTEAESITFHRHAHRKLIWGLPSLSLTNNSSWLPYRRVAKRFC